MGKEVGGGLRIGNLWRIHVDVWQNQYIIVKQNKVIYIDIYIWVLLFSIGHCLPFGILW